MKEFIVDFELYKDGVVTNYLQNSFSFDEGATESEYKCAFEFFRDYARKEWNVYDGVRIKNIWVIEV